MKKTIYLIVMSCLFSFATCPAFAAVQPDLKLETKSDPKNELRDSGQWWVNLGIGGGGGSGFGGGTAAISANYRLSEHQLISARFLKTHELLFNNSYFKDAGLMYGLIAKGKYAYISGSAGVGYAEYHREDTHIWGLPSMSHRNETHSTVGIPVEAQLFLTPTRYVGIGIIGFADVNSVKTVDGVMLALQFGNLD